MFKEYDSVAIIGGTGTLGHALARNLVEHDHKGDVYIISRCENRQKKMKALYPDFHYIIGDITRIPEFGWPEVDYAFNFAAMKHVEIAEKNVTPCIDINLQGTINFADYCEREGVKRGIYTSTDKAVLPVNAYGAAKMLSERYLLSRGDKFQIFRWGNVLGSRGSVLPIFKAAIEEKKKVQITDKRMTRFWIHIDDVASYMLELLDKGPGPHIPPMKSAKVIDVARAVARCMDINKIDIEETEIRDGEKLHECLWTSHEHCLRSDNSEEYSQNELTELVQRALHQGVVS